MEKMIVCIVALLGLLQFGYKQRISPREDAPKPVLTINDSTFNAISYLFDNDQLVAYESLDNMKERMDYINSFWNTYSSKSNSAKLRSTFSTRTSYADSAYSEVSKKGWQTDRGRIHILYGQPMEVVRELHYENTFNQSVIPGYSDFEVWQYSWTAGKNPIPHGLKHHNRGKVFFVFSYVHSQRENIQIFSTETGEKLDMSLYNYWKTTK